MKDRRRVRALLGVQTPRLYAVDLLREAGLSIKRHAGRSLATAVGTVLGAAAFVATLGLSSTLQQQVSSTFDVRRATEVMIKPGAPDLDPGWHTTPALARLRGLDGVAHAGQRIELGEQPVTRALGATPLSIKVVGADPGALAVLDPQITAGRRYDTFHEARGVFVAMLAEPVAAQLNITRTGIAVFINNRPFTVIGIFDDVVRRPESLLSVLIPASAAETFDTEQADRDVIVATDPGAAQLIGSQAPLALRPEGPASLRAITPPDPRTLRQDIESSVKRSSLLLSVIALVIGAVSIGNATTAAIAARTGEIGLRRALGARPIHIFAQLLAETTALGAFGGVTGAGLGVFLTAAVSLWQRWVPVIDLQVAVVAVAAGAIAGLAAGLLPALKAIRITPVAALQR